MQLAITIIQPKNVLRKKRGKDREAVKKKEVTKTCRRFKKRQNDDGRLKRKKERI